MKIGDIQSGSQNGCDLQGFDAALGLRLARASAEAYSGPFTNKVLVSDETGLDLLTTVEAWGDYVIVANRGTQSLENWRVDLDAKRTATGVHSGFAGAERALRPGVRAAIAKFPGKKLLFTGHSLGGAIAEEQARAFGCEACITFGQPRVLIGSVARQTRIEGYWRVINKEDIVPHLPGLLMGYRHFGNLLFFPCLGEVEVNPPWWRQWVSHALGIGADLARLWSHELPRWVVVREHSAQDYVNDMATLPVGKA